MLRFNKAIMLSFKAVLAASLALLVGSLASVSAGKLTILDDAEGSADMETIALAVCEKLTGTGKQIAHISTIHKLAHYLRVASSPDHKLHSCSQKYLNSLDDLVEVLDSANDNVCGDQKLKLIEDFHQKYVSKVRKHVESQKRHSKVPKVVKLFFMQYASEISTRCEQAAVEMVAKREHKISEQELESMNKIKAFTDALGMSDLSKGYEGIYLLWNMVDNLPLEEDEKFSQYLEQRGSSVRLNVQLNDARALALVQTVCSSKMKPVYSHSILPALRLADLGYYPQNELGLAKDFQNPNSAAHNLLVATQICETILPLRVYQDQQLKGDQIVALTRDEAAQLTPLEVPNKLVEEIEKELPGGPVQEVSMVGLDQLPAVQVGGARQRVELIKSAVESRSNIMMRMFRMCVKNMKNKIKSSLGSYLLSRKSRRNLLDEAALEKIDLDEEVAQNNRRRRRRDAPLQAKSSVWEKVNPFGILKNIVLLVAQLILWALKIVFLLAPTALLIIADCLTFGHLPMIPVYKRLFQFWEIPRLL